MSVPKFELSSLVKASVPKSWISQTFKAFNRVYPNQESVSIVLAPPAVMQKLNQRHRGKDKPTNVLSFTLNTPDCLGEIFLCPSIIEEEAKKLKRPLQEYFQYILIHGLLHIVGWDHNNIASTEKMEKEERKLLKLL